MNVDSSGGTEIYSVFAEASDSRQLAVKRNQVAGCSGHQYMSKYCKH